MHITFYRKTATLSLLATLLLSLCFFTTVNATGQNAVQNPGFEYATDWETFYSSFQGSYAQVQDSTYKYNGTYSGLTQTTNPKQEFCSASLYQSLEVPVLNVSTFSYWIRKGESALNGYYSAEVQIQLSGYTLHYYHPINSQEAPMPQDTDTHKYINAGSLVKPSGVFILGVSRDLYVDLTNKFGYFIADHNITGIKLLSRGSKNLQSGEKFGQRINWDHVYMQPCHPRTQINKWAVLICGGWPGAPLQQGIVNAINMAYTTLQGLGYDNETIYLVSPMPNHDADGDNISDVDAYSHPANISSSITSWLKGHSDPNDICFIYAMSHGGGQEWIDMEFHWYFVVVEGNKIYDYQMAGWINQVAYGTLTFAIEACYSGGFIEDVSDPDNRIVITSTTDDKGCMNDKEEDMIPCFSYGFFHNLSEGGSVGDAFNAGWLRVQAQWGNTTNQYDPWLDDNGDGVGHKGVIPFPHEPDGELAIITWL